MQLWEVGPRLPEGWVSSQLTPLHWPPPQAAKIITYREPDNPEYLEFLQQLKHLARDQFNFTIEDGLVGRGPGTLQCGPPAPPMALCPSPPCSLSPPRIPRSPPLPLPLVSASLLTLGVGRRHGPVQPQNLRSSKSEGRGLSRPTCPAGGEAGVCAEHLVKSISTLFSPVIPPPRLTPALAGHLSALKLPSTLSHLWRALD